MSPVLRILAVWCALSVPVGVLAGRFLRGGAS